MCRSNRLIRVAYLQDTPIAYHSLKFFYFGLTVKRLWKCIAYIPNPT